MNTGNKALTSIVSELNGLGLKTMADTLVALYASKEFLETDRLMLLTKIVGAEYEVKASKRLENRLKRAKLIGSPCEIEKCVDSKERGYLPHGIADRLASGDFISNGMNICVLGPSDSGKTYFVKALGVIACQNYRVAYFHCETFCEEMVALKKRDYQKYQTKMKYYTNLDLLILDDFLLHTIADEREIKVLFELLEKRNELLTSTIVCSQREPKSWASMMLNDEVSSNSIMKRVTKHYTVVINLK